MENPAAPLRFAPTALMLGNFVTGCSVLAPAGMLGELSSELDVTIRSAGLLITFGRRRALHRLAADGLADQPDRAPAAAGRDAGRARARKSGICLCT
jgi:hypothetical protein